MVSDVTFLMGCAFYQATYCFYSGAKINGLSPTQSVLKALNLNLDKHSNAAMISLAIQSTTTDANIEISASATKYAPGNWL